MLTVAIFTDLYPPSQWAFTVDTLILGSDYLVPSRLAKLLREISELAGVRIDLSRVLFLYRSDAHP